jgi:uncharacterized protein Yka (UPF0111/DUF47 family)
MTNIDKSISYSEYIAENLDKFINYSKYVDDNLDKIIDYSEYIAEQLDPHYKEKKLRKDRCEKIKEIFEEVEMKNTDDIKKDLIYGFDLI